MERKTPDRHSTISPVKSVVFSAYPMLLLEYEEKEVNLLISGRSMKCSFYDYDESDKI